MFGFYQPDYYSGHGATPKSRWKRIKKYVLDFFSREFWQYTLPYMSSILFMFLCVIILTLGYIAYLRITEALFVIVGFIVGFGLTSVFEPNVCLFFGIGAGWLVLVAKGIPEFMESISVANRIYGNDSP